jgi:hypothetical protein
MKWMLASAAVTGVGCVSAAVLFAALVALILWLRRRRAVDPLAAWAQGVIALYRGDVGDPGAWSRADADEHLSHWSCPDRAALVGLLERYHQGETDLPGWDKARLIFLARVGAARGDLTAEESWEHVRQARSGMASIADWADLASQVERGKLSWYQDTDELDSQLKMTRAVRAWAEAHALRGLPFRA